jgi:hypothetical protein
MDGAERDENWCSFMISILVAGCDCNGGGCGIILLEERIICQKLYMAIQVQAPGSNI